MPFAIPAAAGERSNPLPAKEHTDKIFNTMRSESLFALLAGAAIGVTVGLLFAPEKGEETRKKIKEAAQDGYEKAKELGSQAGEKYAETKAKVSEDLNSLKDLLSAEGANLKEAARIKILEQLDRLEKALEKESIIDDQTQEA